MSSSDLRVQRLHFEELRIPFKVAFRHASAERTETSSVWIDAAAENGTTGCGESCPRPYVTGETIETARAFFTRREAGIRAQVVSVESLRAWTAAYRTEIDANPAAWCAIELAILDLLGKWLRRPLEALVGVPPLAGRFLYTAVLGDASATAFSAMAEQYWQLGIRDFKIKLSGDSARDREKVSVLQQWPSGSLRVRADANNLWSTAEDTLAALSRLDYPFFAIEEPIAKDRHAELPRIAAALNARIVLDESFARIEQLHLLSPPASQWLINIRVSKMGGLMRSLEVVDAARAAGIGIIVGAQVGETSVLTRAALTVAHAAAGSLVAQEGAFGTLLLERDVCDPPLMFGAGGVLEVSSYPALAGDGFGVLANRAAAGG
jgi:L-alanine-DL-glutamate epimerase-like enolase superfamily enzyme